MSSIVCSLILCFHTATIFKSARAPFGLSSSPRAPLGHPHVKKAFPVCRVAKKMPVGRSGFIFPFLISFFINYNVQGGGGEKKRF